MIITMAAQNAFPCFICTASFAESQSLISHIKVLHSSLSIHTFTCKYEHCFREFDRIKYFAKHVSGHKKRETGEQEDFSAKRARLSDAESDKVGENPRFEDSERQGDEYQGERPTEQPNTYVTFFNAVSNSVATCLARLYTRDNLTRSQVQDVVGEMKELFCGSFLDLLRENVMQALETSQSKDTGQIRILFDILKAMFDDVDTEWKRIKYFSEKNAFVSPEQYSVGTANVHKTQNGQVVVQPATLTGTFISPTKTLQSFLELPGVLDKILAYMDDLDRETEIMENVVQGTLWRDEIKPKFGDKTVLPLTLSFDEFETNKDLGSHTVVHKLMAGHVAISSLPPAFLSQLENMFLTILYHASDKAFGLEEVFRPLLEDLLALEADGIDVVVGGKARRIHFSVCLITGDNLGLQVVFGLAESFSATFFCRICKVPKDLTRTLVYERKDLYRNRENYEEDLNLNDVKATGVKVPCIWNKLSSFHLTANLYADIMHDVIEGFAQYDMCFIIEHIVREKWVTSYEELNDLVQGFYYGSQEFGNKPPLICKDKVKTESLGFSASEVLCLVRYFSLMVGHKAKVGDQVWQFYLKLRELVDILFAPTFMRSDIPRLNVMIAEHHSSYLSLSGRHLKPKYHFALHYGTIIEKIGPLQPVWAMRSESTYHGLREAAHVTSTRKNVSYTLAFKSCLKNCARFLGRRGLEHRFNYSPLLERVLVSDLDSYDDFAEKIPDLSVDSGYWNVVNWVKVDGTVYRTSMIVTLALDNFFPRFGCIEFISVTENKEARFLVKELVTLSFDEHFHAYEVQENPSRNCWRFVKQNDLVNHIPAHKRLCANGNFYVMPRHVL